MEQEKEKVFRGWRDGKLKAVTLNNKAVQPKVFNGLPLAFDWGNASLEARQLSYSILSELFDEDIARRFYLDFVATVIQDMATDHWTLPEKIIRKEIIRISDIKN